MNEVPANQAPPESEPFAPMTAADSSRPADSFWNLPRLGIGLLMAIAAGFGAFLLFFIGAVEFTGCFISCSDPNRPAGTLWLAGAAAVAATAVTALGWGIAGRRAPLRALFMGSAAVAATVIAAAVVSGEL